MFKNSSDLNRADWQFLQNAAVNLFHDKEILVGAENALIELGYEIAEVTCRNGLENLYVQFSSLLRWEEQFGYKEWNGNLNAFNDGLSGYPFGPNGQGALIIDGFQDFVSVDPQASHAVLDMLESSARDHLLWGNKLIVLVQTDDREYECAHIGCRSAHWNAREWKRS